MIELHTYGEVADGQSLKHVLPRLERVLDLSMMALLLGLFNTDLLARDISAVTLVMDILPPRNKQTHSENNTTKIFRSSDVNVTGLLV